MKLLIDRFPEFLSDAISIGEGAQLSPLTKKINNIVIILITVNKLADIKTNGSIPLKTR